MRIPAERRVGRARGRARFRALVPARLPAERGLGRAPRATVVLTTLVVALGAALGTFSPTAALAISSPAGGPARGARLAAQEPATDPFEPGSELTIYLMTIGQGDAIWERFGHNAIWVRDAARGTDVAYNYGMFSFDEPGYLRRFMRGQMTYWMEPLSGPASARYYAESNRSVWLQELNLSPAQRMKLRDFLESNAREENKFYEYDYFRDNCSTRVRDAIDFALDGALREATAGRATGTTYRSHSLRLTASQMAAYTGLLLGIGPAGDRPIDAWEEGFIPMKLMEHVREVRVGGPGEAGEPLVSSEQIVFPATRPAAPESSPDLTIAYLAVGLLIGGALALLALLARGRKGETHSLQGPSRAEGGTTSLSGRASRAEGGLRGRASRLDAETTPFTGRASRAKSGRAAAVGFLVLAIAWSIAAGFFGSVLAALWAFTDHVAAHRSENLFQLNPLSLVLAALLPFTARPAVLRAAAIVALAIAALSVLGFLLQVLPAFDQVNGGIIALALPPHAALAWALARKVREAAGGRARDDRVYRNNDARNKAARAPA